MIYVLGLMFPGCAILFTLKTEETKTCWPILFHLVHPSSYVLLHSFVIFLQQVFAYSLWLSDSCTCKFCCLNFPFYFNNRFQGKEMDNCPCEVILFHHEDIGIPWEIANIGVHQGMLGDVKNIELGVTAIDL